MQHRIALIGLSGSGKTTVGPLIAQVLGWPYVDIDAQIVAAAGQPITEIFAQRGEQHFREIEAKVLHQALSDAPGVIATGGGVVENTQLQVALQESAFVVWLHAPPQQLGARLRAAADRPLLGDDPAAALQRMAERRSALYASIADWIVPTATLTPQQIADEVVRAFTRQQSAPTTSSVQVTTPGGHYLIEARAGLLDTLPDQLDRLRLDGNVWLVSDTTVMPLHGQRVLKRLQEAGRTAHSFSIPMGEQHKTLDTVRDVYDWLLSSGVERGDVILALGGGVVGDLAGFVAATVLRGIAVVQLPTTVLAMVDSAIGGKTGVDHAVGKNLVGAFHQPRLVLADTAVLATLPAAERAAGWTEAIKHGVIGDAALFEDLRRHAEKALALEEPLTGQLILRAAGYKARVVSGDEREQGERILLNYGHTIGHALEAESNYTLRHGEAVAIGMMAAGTIALRVGLFSHEALAEQRAALEAFRLPTRIPQGVDLNQILARIGSDKKVRAKRVRWVLPTRIGAAVVRSDVPGELVADVLQELVSQ